MGWGELESGKNSESTEQDQKKRADELRAIKQCARVAFAADKQKPLRDYLRKVAMASSFAPSRSHADIAYVEGQRAFALKLLELGGNNE